MELVRLHEKLAAEVERWNRDNPVGTRVQFGDFGVTTTSTAAFVHNSRSCVWLSAPSLIAELAEVWPC